MVGRHAARSRRAALTALGAPDDDTLDAPLGSDDPS